MMPFHGLALVLLALLSLFGMLESREAYRGDGMLHVDYLDVGQGDATLITAPGGMQVLIDGGRDTQVLGALRGVMPYFDRTIDLVVATHPDLDHIAGLVHVLKRYHVTTVLMTNNESDAAVYGALQRAIEAEGARVEYAMAGMHIGLGAGASGSSTLSVLFPDRDVREVESNTSSIVLRLSYGASDFLFMGDAPQAIETYLVGLFGDGLASEVLKVGHHGSRTSTAATFVAAVDPDFAVISAGKDNTYGHPHKEVLETLKEAGVSYRNTADSGTISVTTDGNIVRVMEE